MVFQKSLGVNICYPFTFQHTYKFHCTSCTLHTAHCTLQTAHCPLYTSHPTLQTSHSTVYTSHFTLHTSHCTLHIHTTPCTLQYTDAGLWDSKFRARGDNPQNIILMTGHLFKKLEGKGPLDNKPSTSEAPPIGKIPPVKIFPQTISESLNLLINQ